MFRNSSISGSQRGPSRSISSAFLLYAMVTTALMVGYGNIAVAAPQQVDLPGDHAFPESLTSTQDSTLFVGSFAEGGVLKVVPGATAAESWIKPGANGSRSTFGVLADEKSNTLLVCSNNTSGFGVPSPGAAKGSALKAFDLRTGEAKGSTPLPGDVTLCNDIAIGADGAAYVTDSFNPHILRLNPGGSAFEVWATDPRFMPPKGGAGLDGIAFGSDGAVYVVLPHFAWIMPLAERGGGAGRSWRDHTSGV